MTYEQIKELLANMAKRAEEATERAAAADKRAEEAQKRAEEAERKAQKRAEEMDKRIAELNASIIETKKMIEQNGKDIQELRKSQQKTEELMHETAEQMKKTDEQMRKTDEKLKRMGKRLGSMGFNIGLSAEEYFFRDLEEKPTLGTNTFDSVERRIRKNDNDVEHDILLDNGETTAIIEVKFKAHTEDIKDLVTRKLMSYKSRYVIAPHKSLYLGLATMSSDAKLERMARDYGIYLLTQQGNRLELVNEQVKGY